MNSGKIKTVNIGFINTDGRDDETQFDVTNMDELKELWFDFCVDEKIITYVEEVAE